MSTKTGQIYDINRARLSAELRQSLEHCLKLGPDGAKLLWAQERLARKERLAREKREREEKR